MSVRLSKPPKMTEAEAEMPVVQCLLGIIEEQAAIIQELKDEVAILKGEKARPKIPGSRLENEKKKEDKDKGDKGEGGEEKKKPTRPGSAKRKKTKDLKIHQEKRIKPEGVPADAVLKDCQKYVVQDIQIQACNTRYILERWVTPEGQSFIGKLPQEIKGHFGPTLRSLVHYLHHQCHVTQPLLYEALGEWDIDISTGQVNRILTEGHEAYHREKDELLSSGLQSSQYVQVDDTGARHQGVNGYCTHIGNEWFAYFASTQTKSRLNFLTLLRGNAKDYVLNEDALEYMAGKNLAKKVTDKLKVHQGKVFSDKEKWEAHLKLLGIKGKRHVQIATEGALLGSALAHGLPKNLGIVSDDAGQFNILSHALCWIHAERHINKINSHTEAMHKIQQGVRDEIWTFYQDLKAYKKAPDPSKIADFEARFDTIFQTSTGHILLDIALRRLHGNKAELLLVLKRPELPLHNNLSESDIREYVKRRKVSGSTRSDEGRRCRDTFTSLKKTCRKLGQSFWKYLNDRNGTLNADPVPYLPNLVKLRATSQGS